MMVLELLLLPEFLVEVDVLVLESKFRVLLDSLFVRVGLESNNIELFFLFLVYLLVIVQAGLKGLVIQHVCAVVRQVRVR